MNWIDIAIILVVATFLVFGYALIRGITRSNERMARIYEAEAARKRGR